MLFIPDAPRISLYNLEDEVRSLGTVTHACTLTKVLVLFTSFFFLLLLLLLCLLGLLATDTHTKKKTEKKVLLEPLIAYVLRVLFFFSCRCGCDISPTSPSYLPSFFFFYLPIMPASAAAAKVAPKTLNQFRNFSYIVVAWFGFNKGFREKMANDAAWVEHQQKVRQQNVERFQAAHAFAEAKRDAEMEKGVPAMVPEDLHELYKDVEKALQ